MMVVSAVVVLMFLISSSHPSAQLDDPRREGIQDPPGKQDETVSRNRTTTREVRPFTPVTDEILRNPDPEDWLMIHRTYDFQGYSPLGVRDAIVVVGQSAFPGQLRLSAHPGRSDTNLA